ncbi:MAG: FtsQ-type POTRA domain-containing protein [Oscillospiraceae bacterium]|nr:FtsQ-type POTRA domain-containing protein [Oscillospiraceae bacterium]
MAGTRRNRRRRRGRYSFLLKLFGFAVAVAAILAAVTLFFRMDHIVVQGCERYSEQDIVGASGLKMGGNLYFLNKYDVKEAIFAKLPYVEEVRINRKLPDTLLIEVRECKAAAGVSDATELWLISDQGKLLEKTTSVPAGCPLITGASLIAPAPSAKMDAGKDAAYRTGVVLTLLRESAAHRMRENIGEIEMGDDTALSFTYLGRFTVRLPWTADLDYKLDNLAYVVDNLENNETGRIDLMTEGKASFIPAG